VAFVTDKEELKPGLIIFRRGDVDHRNWYCRVKLPKADRYKTVSLKTADLQTARHLAWEQEVEIRALLKRGVPVFNRPFSQVGEEYISVQEKRADIGEITRERIRRVKSVIRHQLGAYVGATQIHLIGPDRWTSYPAWRRAAGQGRLARPGSLRPMTEAEIKESEAKAAERAKAAKGALIGKSAKQEAASEADKPKDWIIVSDSTIRFEMSIFRGVMTYAASKRYISADQRFEGRPNLKTERRDEFTLDEYRRLHTKARAWIKAAPSERPTTGWYRTVVYNFILIMCNTGMRPPEARNLRWRDITYAKDRDGREVAVLSVRGKGKSRKLVAPPSVIEYLERIQEIARAKGPDDHVFTTSVGKPTKSLYDSLVAEVLTYAGLRAGPSGTLRSTYCFRHTYATLRLSEGVDVYFLAEQMGTSVKMIEEHYGNVNTIKYADRVLQGMSGWDPVESDSAAADRADKRPAEGGRRKIKGTQSAKDADVRAAHAASARSRTSALRVKH
jgi:integrase